MALAEDIELREATEMLRVRLLTELTREDMLSQDTTEDMDRVRPRGPANSSSANVSPDLSVVLGGSRCVLQGQTAKQVKPYAFAITVRMGGGAKERLGPGEQGDRQQDPERLPITHVFVVWSM